MKLAAGIGKEIKRLAGRHGRKAGKRHREWWREKPTLNKTQNSPRKDGGKAEENRHRKVATETPQVEYIFHIIGGETHFGCLCSFLLPSISLPS